MLQPTVKLNILFASAGDANNFKNKKPKGVSKKEPSMTYEELAKGDGINGNPILLALNGKVLEYDENYPYIRNIKKGAGGHLEVVVSRLLYEPRYGAPEKIE